jgi:hypothetical protein
MGLSVDSTVGVELRVLEFSAKPQSGEARGRRENSKAAIKKQQQKACCCSWNAGGHGFSAEPSCISAALR